MVIFNMVALSTHLYAFLLVGTRLRQIFMCFFICYNCGDVRIRSCCKEGDNFDFLGKVNTIFGSVYFWCI